MSFQTRCRLPGKSLRIGPATRWLAGALMVAWLFPEGTASAAKIQVLYDFCPAKNCSQSFSSAGLSLDQSGNLYGTRENDGTKSKGTAFELSFDGSKWNYVVLHDFCSAMRCLDGAQPESGLVVDTAGNVYGTATIGGYSNQGVFFEISSSGAYQVLYSFCPDGLTCSDGALPVGNLTYSGAQTGQLYDGTSPVFGTGGVSNNGVVFELTSSGGTWTSTTAYSFSNDGQECFSEDIIMDASSNLFGSTEFCGDDNTGKAFVLSNSQGAWTESSSFSFTDIRRGYEPFGPLVEDSKGVLYVATEQGGKAAAGTLMRLTPHHGTYLPKVLRQFDIRNGTRPMGGLVADTSGNLFGTTRSGGKPEGGTVFELSGNTLQVLYEFCVHDSTCGTGKLPIGQVVLDSAGNLYGITTESGANGFGTVFEITP